MIFVSVFDGYKNMNALNIVRLRKQQLEQASQVLSKSFFNYPMFTFYFPDIKRRVLYLPWYFRQILNCARRYGKVYTTPDVTGVIFSLPPEHTKISMWEYIKSGFLLTPLIMGFRNYKRARDCERFVEETQERIMKLRPHYYLWGLAVDINQKAKGISSALMQPVLDRADQEEMPVYLETHSEANIPYYRRHGFELIASETIPMHNLSFWCMVRESN